MRGKFWSVLRKAIGYFILFLLLSWLINYWRAPSVNNTEQTIPSLTGLTLQGKPVPSLLKPGTPLVLHFWGTWCPVCRLEASNFNRIATRYRLLSIAVQSGSDKDVKAWMKKHDIRYPVLNDPAGTLAKRFGVTVFPTTFIYGSDGKLKSIETGYTSTLGLLIRLNLAQWL